MSNTLDEKDLTILALRERIASLIDENTELRVQYTIASNKLAERDKQPLLPLNGVLAGELVEDN